MKNPLIDLMLVLQRPIELAAESASSCRAAPTSTPGHNQTFNFINIRVLVLEYMALAY
jgi:hypothetical protein